MRNSLVFLIVAYVVFLQYGCKREFDHPPYKAVDDGAKLLISQLKARLSKTDSYYKFGAGDTNLYGYVVADETNGNLFKQVYLSDDAGSGLLIKLKEPGGLFTGDKIRINLNGLYLVNANNVAYLDSVDIVKNAVKISSGHKVVPKVTTIPDILKFAEDPLNPSSLQSRLIELNGVEFISADRNNLLGDPIGKNSTERTITDCQNNKIVIRSSGFANFASKTTPAGNGKLIAIVSQYGKDMQLLLRNYNELMMTGSPCTGVATGTNSGKIYLSKDFNDNNLTSGGWANVNVSGNINWTASFFGGQTFAKISNYTSGSNKPCETWLISPGINLSAASNPALTFRNAFKYDGPTLEAFISTNYNSGSPATASWTKLQFNLSEGDYVFADSGELALANYKNSNVRIAFKYTGTSNAGSTWELDDVIIMEQ